MKRFITKYAGEYVAYVDDDNIIASGKNNLEVYQKAKHKFPQKLISLEYIPTKKELDFFITPFPIEFRISK